MRPFVLLNASVPLRPPRIAHRYHEPYHLYIRRWEKWGNPSTMIRDDSREEIIAR